ncbi:glycosyl transferase [Paenibacillus cisolokensis]|uniref:glycosyl transferase n=1 Tax=Paenibacillus cisolokensis TaxID=1658519 RepID=UPI003D2D1F9B
MDRRSVRFDHLDNMTDDTGILEHALGTIPRRNEGYSTDDQARALWVCQEWSGQCSAEDQARLERLAETYMAFLLWAQREDGHFHNNFAYDRSKEPELPSDDCLGRCLWACAKVMTAAPRPGYAFAAESIFRKALQQVGALRYPRGWAYALAALAEVERHGFDIDLSTHIKQLADRLVQLYRQHSAPNWPWFEPEITYSNAILPWGMLWAYESLKRPEMLDIAVSSLDFLISISQSETGHIRPIGNDGWCGPNHRALWDQQPIDVMKLALAAAKAYELTEKPDYQAVVWKCRDWFYGHNDLGTPMMNTRLGSCCDGLSEDGPNRNCGAEAVISYLLTEAICHKLPQQQTQRTIHA